MNRICFALCLVVMTLVLAAPLLLAQTQVTVTIQDVLSAPEKWVNRDLQLVGEIRLPQQSGEVGRGSYQLCGPKGEAITVRTRNLPGAGEMNGMYTVNGSVDVDPATSMCIVWESSRQPYGQVSGAAAAPPPPAKPDMWTYLLIGGAVVLVILIVALVGVLRKPAAPAQVIVPPGAARDGATMAAPAAPAAGAGATQAYVPTTPATQEFLGVTLAVSEGPDVGKSFAISKSSTSIGRAPGQDVHLSDGTVSREHARLLAQAGGLQIVNQSTRGTLVNGQEADSKALSDGDEIQMGATKLTVKMAGGRAAASAATQEYRPAGAASAAAGETQEYLGAQLEVEAGPHSGMVYAISKRAVSIGRSEDQDVALVNDQTVSREHCQLRVHDGQFTLVAEPDKKVLVNGQETVTVTLNDGDEIQLGGSKLRFRRL
jgi:pSer/pThr/pTyr-binding forkhead associated (FHA) protein